MKNRRLWAIIVLAIVALACVTAAAACEPPELPEYDMSGITFANGTVSYDGQAHTLEITGTLPEGVTVAYEYYSGETKLSSAPVDAGEYKVVAKFTGDNEHKAIADKTATLTISSADYVLDVTLADKTVTYDGQAHTLEITGTLPAGVTVAYEYYKGETKLSSAPVNGGTYKVVAKFTGDASHNAIADKTATLTINKADIEFVIGAKKNADGDALATNVEFTKKADGSFAAYVADDTTYTVEVLSSSVEVDFDWYGELNDDNTVKESSLTNGKLVKIGDVRYLLITLRNAADRENYNDNVIVCAKGEQRVVEIRAYDDLLTMASDIEDYSVGVRLGTVYKLMNDIDCGGKVWKTIGTRFAATDDKAKIDASFLSELDGQGHKIYNFKLTDESVKKEYINDTNGILLGFFGYLSDATVKNVTFADITVDFSIVRLSDTEKYGENAYVFQATNWIYFGVVAGRVNICEMYGRGTHFENINVENLNVTKLSVSTAYIGTFVGFDTGSSPKLYETKQMHTRKNLTAKNIDITAEQNISLILDKRSEDNSILVRLGGFTGAMFTYMPLMYENCSIDGLSLTVKRDLTGLDNDEEAFVNARMAGYVPFLYQVGGHRDNAIYGDLPDGFKNCSIKNYFINDYSNTNKAGFLYGPAGKLAFVECTAENDEPEQGKEYGMFHYLWNEQSNKFKKYVYTVDGSGAAKWAHVCTSICSVCGKCTDEHCQDLACADKCLKHGDEHICLSQCPICHKCLNPNCQEPHCQDKCPDNHTGDELLDYDYSGVTFADKEITYDGHDQTIVIGGADLPDGVTVSYTYYKDTVAEANKLPAGELPLKSGTYKVVATFTGDRWHKVVDKVATLKINKLVYDTSNVKFEDTTVTYDGEAKTIPLSGLPEGVTLEVVYTYYVNEVAEENKLASAPVNVGTYKVVATFVGGGEDYDPIPDMTATLTIEKATFAVQGEMSNKTVTYNGKAHTIVLPEQAFPAGITVAYEYYQGETKLDAAPVNAGIYKVTAKFTVNDNYDAIADMTATLTISKLDVEFSFGATANADGADLGGKVVFRKTGNDSFDAYVAANGIFASYTVTMLSCSIDGAAVHFYDALNTDGTVNESANVDSDATLSSARNVLYAKVVLPEGYNIANYNLPVITLNKVVPTAESKVTVEMRTYEDLLSMAADAEILPQEIRLNLIYKLMNDIDCGGKVWKTIGPISIGAGTQGTKAFVSELTGENTNGQDYKIHNFQLTNDSVDEKYRPHITEPTKNTHALAFGFFGYVSVAKVHNVTFDSITVNINQGNFWGTENAAAWIGNSYIQFGVVAGYVGISWENDFHDITVSNLNANIIIVGGSVGTFFGVDEGRDPNLFKNNNKTTERKNLTASDVSITARKSYYILAGQTPGISLGGLVGELKTTAPVYYVNCSVSDIALMTIPYPQTTGSDRIFEGYLGGFVGKHDTVEWANWNKDITADGVTYPAMASELLHDKFTNCTISNYKLINRCNHSNKDFTDIYCGYEASPSNSAKYRKEVQFNDCQYSLPSDSTGYGINHYAYNAETGQTDIYVCSMTDGEKTWTLAKSI